MLPQLPLLSHPTVLLLLSLALLPQLPLLLAPAAAPGGVLGAALALPALPLLPVTPHAPLSVPTPKTTAPVLLMPLGDPQRGGSRPMAHHGLLGRGAADIVTLVL